MSPPWGLHYSSLPIITGVRMASWQCVCQCPRLEVRCLSVSSESLSHTITVRLPSSPFEFSAQDVKIALPEGSDQLDPLPGGPNLQLIATFQQ